MRDKRAIYCRAKARGIARRAQVPRPPKEGGSG